MTMNDRIVVSHRHITVVHYDRCSILIHQLSQFPVIEGVLKTYAWCLRVTPSAIKHVKSHIGFGLFKQAIARLTVWKIPQSHKCLLPVCSQPRIDLISYRTSIQAEVQRCPGVPTPRKPKLFKHSSVCKLTHRRFDRRRGSEECRHVLPH